MLTLHDGELGFKSFESFNMAVMAKLGWWVLSNRDSFCVKILRAKYRVHNNWLNSGPTKNASWSQRGLEAIKPLMAKGASKRIGNSDSIWVWDEPWILDVTDFIPKHRRGHRET